MNLRVNYRQLLGTTFTETLKDMKNKKIPHIGSHERYAEKFSELVFIGFVRGFSNKF